VHIGNSYIPTDALKGMIASQLPRSGITERFVQQIDPEHGPSGWRAAVLIAGNDQALCALLPAGAVVSQSTPRLSSGTRLLAPWASGGMSVVAMVLVIAMLYLFLKGATGGVFSMRPRMGIATALLIAAAVLLLGSLFIGRAVVTPSTALPARAEIHRP
jgi:hypothetical protein